MKDCLEPNRKKYHVQIMSHLKLEHLLKQSCKVQHLLTRRQLMVDSVINTVFNDW